MDLVDKEDVVFAQVGEYGREVTRTFDRGAARCADGDAHLVRDDVRQRGLAEAGRAIEEEMVERFFALPRRFDGDADVFLGALLAGELVEHARPQRDLDIGIVDCDRWGHETVFTGGHWGEYTARMFWRAVVGWLECFALRSSALGHARPSYQPTFP